jgi:hypothetical protein
VTGTNTASQKIFICLPYNCAENRLKNQDDQNYSPKTFHVNSDFTVASSASAKNSSIKRNMHPKASAKILGYSYWLPLSKTVGEYLSPH